VHEGDLLHLKFLYCHPILTIMPYQIRKGHMILFFLKFSLKRTLDLALMTPSIVIGPYTIV